MKLFFSSVLVLTLCAAPAFAGVDISSPGNGDHVSSPFSLSASASSCSSQSTSSMGYSLDSGDTTMFSGKSSIDAQVSASVGTHTLHVKAWGDKGAVCVTDAKITVSNATDDASADSSIVPSSAVSVSSIQGMSWAASHDDGAQGSAHGSTSKVGSPSHGSSTRKFESSFKNDGAMRFSANFGDNESATSFMYDAWIYVTSSIDHIQNVEMDVNQTMSNGDTVIFGMQCNGAADRWDYTENLGSASHPKGHWAHSSAHCDLHSWKKDAWHHVQIEYSRTSGGHITYKYVWFDGAKSTIDKTVFGARSMGWGSTLSTNFQLDGEGGSGSATVYLGGLTIYRW